MDWQLQRHRAFLRGEEKQWLEEQYRRWIPSFTFLEAETCPAAVPALDVLDGRTFPRSQRDKEVKVPKISYKEVTTVPAGAYTARITAIEEHDSTYGPALKVHLTTDEGPLECLCSLSYTPKSKLTSLARAAFGVIPADLDTDTLLGKSIGIVVEDQEKDGTTYSKVASFHRLKQQTAAQPALAAQEFEDPFEKAA